MENLEKSWQRTSFEEHRDGVKIGKVRKLENYRIDEEMRSQSEERLCKSIIKGFARRNREKHAMLAEVGRKRTKRHML